MPGKRTGSGGPVGPESQEELATGKGNFPVSGIGETKAFGSLPELAPFSRKSALCATRFPADARGPGWAVQSSCRPFVRLARMCSRSGERVD